MKFKLLALAATLVISFCNVTQATEVVLYPGHIEGSISTALPGYQTKNIHVSASGGGYSASNNISNSNNYSLTVQTGDWNTEVTMDTTVGPEGLTSPSSYLHFEDRNVAVAPNATVRNDYYAGGTVRFNVFITGDAYTSWSGSGYASKSWNNNMSRISSSSSSGTFTANASWEMPVMAASQMDINAGVYVYSKYGSKYYQFSGPDYPLHTDIADGDILEMNLYINHVAPADPGTQPPPPSGGGTGQVDYGSLDLTGVFDMNIDGTNYDSNLASSIIACKSGKQGLYATTATASLHKFFPQAEVGDGYCTAWYTRFKNSTVLYWPGTFLGGTAQNNFTVAKDQTTYVSMSEHSARVEGELRFTGAVTNADLTSGVITFTGAREIYEPGLGWLPQPTNGGYTESHLDNVTGWKFTPFLTGGLWDSLLVQGNVYDNSSGFLRRTDMTIVDYRVKYDGFDYNFGKNIYVTNGQTTHYDREYCLGKATVIFRSADGGLLSKAYATATGAKLREDGKTEMSTSVSAWNQIELAEAPELELYGPEMTYELSGLQVYAADGSLIRFTPQTYTLECGASKIIPVPGPVLSVSAPTANLITNASSETVVGTAGGALPISSISVNGNIATFSSTGNSASPNEVTFSYDLVLADGVNTIRTEAVDSDNIAASDERQIKVDRWVPTLSLGEPIDNNQLRPGMPVNLVVNSADRGYGFNLKVYVDGILLQRLTHTPLDDTSWETESYQTVLTATTVEQVITLEANDLAGNITTYSFVVKGNTPPVLDPIAPVVVNEGGVAEVSANAVDPEAGLLEYAWDLDNNGTFETSGQTAVFSAATLDGPAQANITVQVTDNGGLTAQTTTTVTILNVNPVADFANTSGIVGEGGTASLAFNNTTDPGVADMAAGFSYSYDCTSDGVFEVTDTPAPNYTCSYADNGSFTATGTVRDKDGAATQYSTTIEVANIAPAVGAITVNPSTLSTGGTVTVSADFSDPGLLDTHTATWTWGDGSMTNGLITETAGVGAASGSHVYPAAGSYTITLTVMDNDGGATTVVSATVTVTDPSSPKDDDEEDDDHGDHGSHDRDKDDHHENGHHDGDHGDHKSVDDREHEE